MHHAQSSPSKTHTKQQAKQFMVHHARLGSSLIPQHLYQLMKYLKFEQSSQDRYNQNLDTVSSFTLQ